MEQFRRAQATIQKYLAMLTVPPLLIILVGPSVVGIQQLGSLGSSMGQ